MTRAQINRIIEDQKLNIAKGIAEDFRELWNKPGFYREFTCDLKSNENIGVIDCSFDPRYWFAIPTEGTKKELSRRA